MNNLDAAAVELYTENMSGIADLIHPWEKIDDEHPLTIAEMRGLVIKNLQAVSDLQSRMRRLEQDNAILKSELRRLSDYLIRRAARERGIPAEIDAGILDAVEINTRPQEES